MMKLLRADFYRMYHSKRIWLCAAVMIVTAIFFVIMQYTAMDYEVPLSRVIFLPMTFYGIAMAALVSFFIGDDYSEGVIRNKVVAGRSRSAIYMSNMLCVWSACLVIYTVTILVTVAIGGWYFEKDITQGTFCSYFLLGAFTSIAFGSIFGILSMLVGNKSSSAVVCMFLAFLMLFLCLHTNQAIVQQPYKNGMVNPHYIDGIKRALYEILHDMNPFGQVAQLSAMTCLNQIRWMVFDILWVVIAVGLGEVFFERKDIR